jgi:signal transduction histidine kinase
MRSRASHDLRTPMRAINCFTELMLKNPHAENAAKMGKLVLDSSHRMQALIDNLMDLARGRLTGGIPLNRNADEPEPRAAGDHRGASCHAANPRC